MKNSYTSILVFFLFFLSIGKTANAQVWTNYTSFDGLVDGIIYSIVEDQNNDVWFGTWSNLEGVSGLAKFDGTNWDQFTTADGTTSDKVRKIFEDSNNNLWVGSLLNGLSKFNGVSWTTYTTADGLVNNSVTSIIEDTNGNLWFSTDGGVSKFDGTTWTNYTTADGLVSNNVSTVIQDSSGNFWFGTFNDGVSKFDGVSTWINYTTADGLAANDVFTMIQDRNNDFWFTNYSNAGLTKFDGTSWTIFTTADGLLENRHRAIFEDNVGNLWFGGNSGINMFDGSNLHAYTTDDGLLHNGIRAITQDSQGKMWFGTWSGVSVLDLSIVPIPDSAFEQALIDLGLDGNIGDPIDGVILKTDAETVGWLPINDPINNANLPNVNGKIQDLTGIEAFINLTGIECTYNNIANLDFSSNLKLVDVYASYNSIETINVASNPELKQLFLFDNDLTSLDVGSNPLLETFICQYNDITSLDLSANPNLKVAFCSGNQLTNLNIANGNNTNFTPPSWTDKSFLADDNPNLACIQIDANFVNNISSHWQKDATAVYTNDCSSETLHLNWGIAGNATPNGWIGPDIPFNKTDIGNVFEVVTDLTDGLIKFRADNDWLVGNYGDNGTDGTLNTPPNAQDIPVFAGTYKIVMDLNNLTYSITPYIPALGVVGSATPGGWNNNNGIPDIVLTFNEDLNTWTGNANLTNGEIKFRYENDWSVNFGDDGLDNTLDPNGANIPVAERFYFVRVDLNAMTYSLEDPYVSIPDENFENYLETHNTNGDAVALGDATSMGDGVLNNLTLISKVEAVTNLNVNNSNIASLQGIEAFTNLEILFCLGNQLEVLDVSQNLTLVTLECETNQFSTLDVSNNTALKVLGCANNNLSSIDVSNNLLLEAIWFTNNNITSLNLDVNTALNVYGLSNNPLVYMSIKNGNNANMQYIEAQNLPTLNCIQVDDQNAAYLSQSNWFVDPSISYSNDCGTVYIPDSNFENYLETHNTNGDTVALGDATSMGDGVLNNLTLKSSVEGVTSLNINGLGITSLIGIEAFISLDILYCQYNQLQELDVTHNAALTVLECEGNGLEELNVTQNPLLRVLGFGPNNLTEIDVSQNLALELIWTNGNKLSSINLDANIKLTGYGLSNNPYTYVSLKNGNNKNVTYFEANNTPNLTCINSDAVVSSSMLGYGGKTFSEDCSTSIEGRWIIAPEAGALKVGPDSGSDLWWALNRFGDDIAIRACYLDDDYVFNDDGSFDNELGSETWLEPFQGVASEQCGPPVAPHDGLANASYVYDQLSGTITLNGKGAYLGLPKVINGGTLSDPNDAPNSIIYDVLFSENGSIMTLSINFGPGFWTFKFVKEPVITLDDVIVIDCFGNNNGAINISVSGGAAPVTFAWTKDGDPEFNSANEDQTGLTPGSYNVLFTDVYGLTASLNNVIITEPTLLTTNIVNNSTACSNNATVTAEGGTQDYTYLWSNGATSDKIENVPVGTYDVTVTDANGCTTIASIDLTVGEAFNPSAQVEDVKCFGDSNGIIEVTNANGAAPFSFSKDGITFSDPQETFPYMFNNLDAGTYEIAVRDGNGCTGFVTKTVSQPEELSVTLVSIQSTCSGQNTGFISVATAGGTGGLSYIWTGTGGYTSSQKNISGLAVGEYTLTVTDNNGCTALLDEEVLAEEEIVVSESITNVLCRGTLTGSINLTVSGGSGSGFTYSWTGNITSTSEDIANLGSGTNYNVIITDIESGCTVSESYIITQPAANLSLATSKTNATGCEGGTITATASGGTSPYEYKLDNGDYQSSVDFNLLSSGSYTVWVKDAGGCMSSKVVAITDNGKDEWETNNSKNRAKLIPIGTTINARIALANDTADWFKFDTPLEDGNYTVNFYHPSASFNVQLYPDSRNAAALTPISPSSNQYALTGGEAYFVQITGGLSYDCYDLSISQVASAARSASKKTEVMIINELSVKSYPNPHQGVFNFAIKSPENGTARIELFNILGQLLATRDVSIEKGRNTIVEFNEVASGMILYHITFGNQRVNGKVIGKD